MQGIAILANEHLEAEKCNDIPNTCLRVVSYLLSILQIYTVCSSP